MTTLLLVDDHAIIRQGVAQLLSDRKAIDQAVEAASGAEALAMLEQTRCDMVMLDISLPDISGIDVLQRIKRHWPQLPVLIFSMYHEEQYGVRALKSGAAGYLSKAASTGEMLAAVRQVLSGRKYVSQSLADALVSYVATNSGQMAHERLSHREYQTLCMLGSGKRLTDVANMLSLSVKTVSVYRTRLLEKLNLANNAELTYYVMHNRLVDLGPAQA
ncbi:response regulator [Chitinasiproducens palmae]|uniref:DNA-binding response regulator, NarL/FixJ family, contains REC and HTH domains n=1 Tax=Chitinasiproducens palmae TaxID=1770053 RepID=A0A1H2PKN9_9BURK|nr:response regulator transcription factor [Chitinasiproducens palmae]SDV46572.1 DNA-binding response regulator, NarL/FixJ family, contains REC and HTH domains [Chitinasiproducens palmae]